MKLTRFITPLSITFCSFFAFGQKIEFKEDSVQLRKIYEEALINGECHENLRELCKDIGHRLSGSPSSYKAVKWGASKLKQIGFDSVWLQPVTVPHWVRGNVERLDFSSKSEKLYISQVTALGGSVGTDGNVLKGNMIEVRSFEELKAIPDKDVEGKVVFFNRPMNPALISTFSAYGDCSRYRFNGAKEAALKGATGVIIRSLTLKMDENPHTGVMGYEDSIPKIPAVAISSRDSYNLHNMLLDDPNTEFRMKLSCKILEDTTSYNVIGEIKGSEFPNEYILVGGHLDSWDIGEGAHDDGAGVVHSMEAVRLLKATGVSPKRSIRCVLYMNEENGNKGGHGYADEILANGLNHIFALETDRGGFSPRGFDITGSEEQLSHIKQFQNLFDPYFIHIIKKGFSGVDIYPLNKSGANTCLIGLIPDSQRYFDFHHAASDVWENVNKRELELGSATISSMLYLIDKYGMVD